MSSEPGAGQSSPLAAAVISASLLGMSGLPSIGAAILTMHISMVATVQDYVAERISAVGVEAAGPALVAVGILWLARTSYGWYAVASGVLSILIACAVARAILSPEGAMALSALPACALAALAARHERTVGRMAPMMPITAVLLLGLVSWGWAVPKAPNDVYVLMPDAPSAAEAKFFQNYPQALRVAGIEAKQVDRPEEVPHGSLLLLPWVTSPFTAEPGDPIARRIGQLASERRWTVVVAGEHTDLGGVAARIEAMTGRKILRQDLTVPRGNTDDSGPLHAADLRAWPHEAILNRGATVRIGSVIDKVLLAGDGWWAEPSIGEWLWVGDYIWSPGDRGGRLSLAVSADIDGARWVVIGDNSPFINSQIVADPRAAVRLLEMATLWPGFIRDIVATVLAILLWVPVGKWRSWSPSLVLASVVSAVVVANSLSGRMSDAWHDTYVGESGFDERNFNLTLAENPNLYQPADWVTHEGFPNRR